MSSDPTTAAGVSVRDRSVAEWTADEEEQGSRCVEKGRLWVEFSQSWMLTLRRHRDASHLAIFVGDEIAIHERNGAVYRTARFLCVYVSRKLAAINNSTAMLDSTLKLGCIFMLGSWHWRL